MSIWLIGIIIPSDTKDIIEKVNELLLPFYAHPVEDYGCEAVEFYGPIPDDKKYCYCAVYAGSGHAKPDCKFCNGKGIVKKEEAFPKTLELNGIHCAYYGVITNSPLRPDEKWERDEPDETFLARNATTTDKLLENGIRCDAYITPDNVWHERGAKQESIYSALHSCDDEKWEMEQQELFIKYGNHLVVGSSGQMWTYTPSIIDKKFLNLIDWKIEEISENDKCKREWEKKNKEKDSQEFK